MIFDCHADVLVDVTAKRLKGKKNVLKTDYIKRYSAAGVNGSIFVLWVKPESQLELNRQKLEELIREGISELDENLDVIKRVYKTEDFYIADGEGKLGVMLGVEGLCGIGEDLDMIDLLYSKGVRHASLTWNEEGPLATGVKGSPERGLTPLGLKAIEKLEALGIVVDVSHLNDASFWDVVKVAKRPLIASHSNARSLCPVPRNLTDEQIVAIAATGGVIGINSIREFTAVEEKNQSAKTLVDHVDHMVKLVGIDHVGFGFDFCDMLDTDSSYDANIVHDRDYELYSIEGVKVFVEELERRGYIGEALEKLKYKNFMRVFKEVLK